VKQRLGVFVLVLLCCSIVVRPQAPTAVVNGQVRDSSGGAIAGAKVEVSDDATGIRSTTEMNAEGILCERPQWSGGLCDLEPYELLHLQAGGELIHSA